LVNELTKDADGKLHRGVPVLLAESLGSIGAAFSCEPEFSAVGLNINANHFKVAESGWITGTAHPIEIGPSTHLWRIDLVDDKGQPICMTHITLKLVKSKALAS
jgi:1,4-dihydroxy-2-naphthoyl-CoA hydrolase